MDFKQKISALSAAALPLVALSTFLLIHPAKAHADGDCPDGTYYVGEFDGVPGTCNSGMGGATDVGSSGAFPPCPWEDGGTPAYGPGVCVSDGCAQCSFSPGN